jgi:Helix-turn-helix domain
MARGRKSSGLMVLSPEAHQPLARWPRATTSTAGLARRGKILLRLAAGYSQSDVAPLVGVPRTVVRQWATRLVTQRLAGLAAAPGRGAKGGFSPGGRHPRGTPGLRATGPVGPPPLPMGWRRTRTSAHRRGDG